MGRRRWPGPPQSRAPAAARRLRGRVGADWAWCVVTSARSRGSESSDRSGFWRQLTFIKESPGLLHRQRTELLSDSASTSQGVSPRQGRPALPAVFLCSSHCKELRAVPRQQPTRPGSAPGPGPSVPLRTSSQSPSRLPVRPEAVKRYSSLPHISVASRPIGGAPGAPQALPFPQQSGSKGEARPLPRVVAPGTTWRRIWDQDIAHIIAAPCPPGPCCSGAPCWRRAPPAPRHGRPATPWCRQKRWLSPRPPPAHPRA
ncbi:adenomatous polyposis coli protein 2-like [Oryctolagus cuniculus]|uniref:adenomatous polyposis coli protein 2-like n=1 Tax=Oryctolagus cuniculus TaxID=9986 RepID=UPI003877FE9C